MLSFTRVNIHSKMRFHPFKDGGIDRSTCFNERDMIYLFAPGIQTEFKIFIKA